MAAVSSLDPFSTTTISNDRLRSRSPEATSRTDSSSISASLWAGRTTVRAGGTPVGYRPREAARPPDDDHGRVVGGLPAVWLAGSAAAEQRFRGRNGTPPGMVARPATRPP